jgi:hypothetical protein
VHSLCLVSKVDQYFILHSTWLMWIIFYLWCLHWKFWVWAASLQAEYGKPSHRTQSCIWSIFNFCNLSSSGSIFISSSPNLIFYLCSKKTKKRQKSCIFICVRFFIFYLFYFILFYFILFYFIFYFSLCSSCNFSLLIYTLPVISWRQLMLVVDRALPLSPEI